MLDRLQRGAIGLAAAASLVTILSLIAAIFISSSLIFITVCAALAVLLASSLYGVFAAIEILFD